MAPEVGVLRPATRRSRLDLPQPEGPTMTANSCSLTSSEMPSSAMTAGALFCSKRSTTFSMRSFVIVRATRRSGILRPGQEPIAQHLEELIGGEAEESDHHDAQEDLLGEETAHRIEDEISEPLVAGDELGHHEIGPGPAEGDAERIHDARHGGGNEHA